MKRTFFIIVVLVVLFSTAHAQTIPMDYSYCGYRQSEAEIPDLPNKVYVAWQAGDCSDRIQQAIDYVSSLKPDKRSGYRGAVLLSKGVFSLLRPLRLHTSGVVLRGSGRQQTVLFKTGIDRGAVVYIEGRDDFFVTDTIPLNDSHIEVGSRIVHCQHNMHAGDDVVIWRPSTTEWIQALGCESFGGGKELGYWGWHPSDTDILWYRTISDISGNEITLDAPLSSSFDNNFGGGFLLPCHWPGRIDNCGVENLTIDSEVSLSHPFDEDHAWDGVSISNVRDCWVRMVNFHHLAGSAVVIAHSGSRVTVEDCKSVAPVSEMGGMRRRTFYTLGGQCLFQRCYSEHGIHDFCAGLCAPGPNAFVQCESHESHDFSGSIGSWASGLLFDCVTIDGNDLKLRNLELENHGAGWNAANSMLWQCAASGIHCYNIPDGSRNAAHGCWGQMWGNGEWSQPNEHVKPWSLFKDQLERRLGHSADKQCRILNRLANDATSSPTIEQAIKLSAMSALPVTTMSMWIDSTQFTGSISPEGVTPIEKCSPKSSKREKHLQHQEAGQQKYEIIHGKLVHNGVVIVGGKQDTPWWNGRLRYNAISKATYALTRFVPGAEGRGLTDRIDSVVAEMSRSHTAVFAQNYGLWYDRRRDDHERIRRRDSNVWGPFYEQPFARSGQSLAWDGLSKYDLERLNPWYFHRLNQFAELASPHGITLLNEHYFQHNILEAGAHWVDCPWRTANNINDTPFTEPVNFSGDKRIFVAEQFYDISNDTLRRLHRQYIRQTLDAFRGQPNVIHSIGAEFTGPYHFVKFWLECISEWEKETGEHPLVALKVNKDVQDSILADASLSNVVDIIAIEQWYDTDKGLYAPPGGVNMAPRQYLRKIKTGTPRFEEIYRSVSSYRQQYPNKAVTYFARNYAEYGWAVFMASGSYANIPVTDPTFLSAVTDMTSSQQEGCYLLSGNHGAVVYNETASAVELPAGKYTLYSINSKSGEITRTGKTHGGRVELPGKGVYWIVKD